MTFNPGVIQQEIANLILLYPELEGDEQLRADMVEAETDAHEFLTMLVRRIGETGAMSEGTALYIKELVERKSRFERRIEALRALALKIMNAAEARKVELPEATLSIRNGTPRVILTDEKLLPDDCVEVVRNPDKATIKLKLAAGGVIPGAVLSNAEPSLSIRIK